MKSGAARALERIRVIDVATALAEAMGWGLAVIAATGALPERCCAQGVASMA